MDEPDASTRIAPPRRRRWRGRLAGVVLAPVLALAAGYAWLGSESALRFVLARAVAATGGRLAIEGAEGSLLSVVRLSRIVWHGEAVDVDARQVALAVPLPELLGKLAVRELLDAMKKVVKIGTSAFHVSKLP